MSNNKTIRDGNGTPFITKTTETAGVNTPHVNIDNFQTNYSLETGGNLDTINTILNNNTQNTVSFYTALQNDVFSSEYYKNDVISRTDFYRQLDGTYLFTRWDNITQGITNLNTPKLANLLLQGIEKDTPFTLSVLPGNASDPIDVSNISSVSFIAKISLIIEGSVDGASYNKVAVFDLINQKYGVEAEEGNIDVSSFKTIRFRNDNVNPESVTGFLSMLPVTPNGEVALQQEGNTSLGSIDTKTPALSGGKVPVTDPITLPLPTGASTENKQTESITQIQKVVKNTIEFYTEDLEEDTATATTYIGKQSVEGQWIVHKIVDAVVGTITTTSLQYATVVNNTSVLTYAGAWTNRSTLTYSEIKNLL